MLAGTKSEGNAVQIGGVTVKEEPEDKDDNEEGKVKVIYTTRVKVYCKSRDGVADPSTIQIVLGDGGLPQ